MIDQFEIALVARHKACHIRLDVVEHLVGSGLDDMDGAFAEFLHCSRRGCGKTRRWWQRYFTIGDSGFEDPHSFFVRGSSGIACADIFVVREDAGDFAVQIDPVDPVRISGTQEGCLLLRRHLCFLLRSQLPRRLAEIALNPAAVPAGIQCGDHGFSVGADPKANVEWNSSGSLLRRIRTADQRGRLPAGVELLRGKSFYTCVGQDGGQRSREAKAVGQHELGAGFAEILSEVFIAV